MGKEISRKFLIIKFSSLFIPICADQNTLFALTDYLLIEDDPLFYFYIGLSILEEISGNIVVTIY
jgi:hypothetical protein